MTNYHLVTGVLGHAVLCVPEGIFKQHFIIDGKYCTHKWYTYLYSNASGPYSCDESLYEAWDNFLETYRMDGEAPEVTFGDLKDVTITAIYQWLV